VRELDVWREFQLKAAQLKDYGPAENFCITEVPTPSPGPGEVLIRVHYAGLRWGDIMGRNGIPMRAAHPPFVPGQEAAGVVVEVGEGVGNLKVGDRVVALPYGGAYAEYLVCSASARISKVPEGVPLASALVYKVNLPTAHLIVNEWAKVQEGESVLVHAAAGGVGTLCVQILKRKFNNVTVIGLAGSDEKCRRVRENGADHVINHKTHDYVAEVEKIVGAKPRGFAPSASSAGVHVVLNGVAGSTLRSDRLIIRPLGRWVLFGTPGGVELVNLFANSYDSITIMPFSMIPFMVNDTAQYARAQAFCDEWLATENLIAPTIHPLEDIAVVQRAMEERQTWGKVVFAIAPE
jgi:NADPH2:quinone reductase